MGKVKDWAMDLEDKFWAVANEKIGECEAYGEFEEVMLADPNIKGCLAFNTLEEVKSELEEGWADFWSKYV